MGRKFKKNKSKTKKQKTVDVKDLGEFDKYYYYTESVQAPDTDALFLRKVYHDVNGKDPVVMREDFCGTFAICTEWAKLGDQYLAVGYDLDPEPIAYGSEHYLSQLDENQRSRVKIELQDVLEPGLEGSDVTCALNFSYFIFKERAMLKKYFANVYNTLNDNGIFVVDCFGGSKCYEPNEEETEYTDEKYSYYWDQDSYDPINNHAQFYIHFKRFGEQKREQVFSYDWRLWSIPEIKDIMMEVGFKGCDVYWEGTDSNGEGNGIFEKTTEGEVCDSWVAYIAAKK